MKQPTTKEINGITFMYTKPSKFNFNYLKDFEQLYKKPSITKRKIYEYWSAKLDKIYGVKGNHSSFTIYGGIYDEDRIYHNVVITPDYNYIIS